MHGELESLGSVLRARGPVLTRSRSLRSWQRVGVVCEEDGGVKSRPVVRTALQDGTGIWRALPEDRSGPVGPPSRERGNSSTGFLGKLRTPSWYPLSLGALQGKVPGKPAFPEERVATRYRVREGVNMEEEFREASQPDSAACLEVGTTLSRDSHQEDSGPDEPLQ